MDQNRVKWSVIEWRNYAFNYVLEINIPGYIDVFMANRIIYRHVGFLEDSDLVSF